MQFCEEYPSTHEIEPAKIVTNEKLLHSHVNYVLNQGRSAFPINETPTFI